MANGVHAAEPPSRVRPAVPDILEVTEETCLTRHNVGARLTPLLASTELPEGLRIALRVDADGKATFEISIPGENVGTRTFETAGLTCENKLRVVSFALAVAIEGIVESRAERLRHGPPSSDGATMQDPPPTVTEERRGPPEGGVAPAASSGSASSGPHTNARESRKAPRTPATWALAAGEGLFTTSLGSSATILASVGRDTARYGVRVTGLQTLGSTVHVGPGDVRHSLTLGRLHGCAKVHRIGAVVANVCAFVGLGAFDARGVGYYSESGGRSPWVDVGLTAEAHWRLSKHWALRVGLSPFAVLRGPTLTVSDARTGMLTASSDVPRIGVLFSLELAFLLAE